MDISIFLAKVIGFYFLIMAAALVVNTKMIQVFAEAMPRQPALTCVTAVFTIILGLLMVVGHNLWVNDWRVVITILAWLTLIKGVTYLMYPKALHFLSKQYCNKAVLIVNSVFILALALFLLYEAFK